MFNIFLSIMFSNTNILLESKKASFTTWNNIQYIIFIAVLQTWCSI